MESACQVGVVQLRQGRTTSNPDATSPIPTSFLGLGQRLVLRDCACSNMKILVRLTRVKCVDMQDRRKVLPNQGNYQFNQVQ
jgi:hypothetical protein